ncbi:Ig-like domain-containing protein [Chloroflexi bacterium TSY]|nr:Ig-like domain-containing protein [Chloroflexi bacterium TSY]
MRSRSWLNLASFAIKILLVGLLLVNPLSNVEAHAKPQANGAVVILESNPQSVILELTVDDLETTLAEHQGRDYERISIPGLDLTATPGAPQLPTRGVLLAVSSLDGLTVDILDIGYTTRNNYSVYPTPVYEIENTDPNTSISGNLVEIFTIDHDLYATDAFYPEQIVTVNDAGMIREQAVAQVQFYPVQFNPVTRKLRHYDRIVVKVSWDVPVQAAYAPSRVETPAFDELLRSSLLNYRVQPPVDNVQAASAAVKTMVTNAPRSGSTKLKIGVDANGIYQITYHDLVDAGFDPSEIDPSRIQLHSGGIEHSIFVQGDGDGTFEPDDYVLFYGVARIDKYTNRNVYWLSTGTNPGLRMTTRDGSPASSTPLSNHFPTTVHAEENPWYWVLMPTGVGEDRFFWGDRISPSTNQLETARTYPISLTHISTAAADATVRVRLQGFTTLDHRTIIYLNDTQIDEQIWSGQIIFDHEIEIAHSLLTEGKNEVRIEAADTDAAVDQVLINWFEIDYWDTYVAEDDQLQFRPAESGNQRFTVSGFNADTVMLFDISNPTNVTLITNTTFRNTGNSNTLDFADNATSSSEYLATTPRRYHSPSTIEVDQPSNWKSPTNGADYIVITHESFYAETLTLAGHRAASGLRVATVKVGDLYDEFNHGVFNPSAIRDFLAYAYENWTAPAPTYVLLVGDAVQDYKDNRGVGAVNYVPTQLVETITFGEFPSDNWFVTISGDDILPDMLIGRLTANKGKDVKQITQKIIAYEQSPPDNSWNNRVTLIADDDIPEFESMSDQLGEHLPHYYSVNNVYVKNYPPGDPTADLMSHIDNGSILVNYSGHGEFSRWGKWDEEKKQILKPANINGLQNVDKYPVVTVANCLNGFFADSPAEISVAERFLLAKEKGAVAVWAPSTLGYPSGHRTLMTEFYDAVFQDDQITLGMATTAAKIDVYAQSKVWGELVETYILFGDPATQLGIPNNYPYIKSTTPANGATQVPFAQDIQIVFSKPVDPTTVNLSGDIGLSFNPNWNSDHTVVTYSHADFAHGASLMFSIDAKDRMGNVLGTGTAPSTWSFTVTNDNISPTGIIRAGDDSPSDITADATIEAEFSEAMQNNSIRYTISPAVPISKLTWDESGQIATFHHTGFEAGQTYTLIITEAKDLAGNVLSAPLELVFTIQEAVNSIYLPTILNQK